MAWIDKLVGKSPIGPIQKHMQVAVLCAREVIPLLEAMAAGDDEAIRERRAEIDRLEHEADQLKHEIRSHMPRRFMMAMDRRTMLEILDYQDSIADVTQDIAELADQRGMHLPESLKEPVLSMAQSVMTACEQGQRIIDELDESVKMAQNEAQNAFADDTVFFESYIAQSRHIEIQILGDNHGNIIHLGERECSIQRRHQKIIEESPSPRIDSNLREQLGDTAVSLAKKINYQSAGTVEFLFDDTTGKFWFLEMNTRLQVEHPVTEEVTGIDIVEQQLLIAADEELSISQQDVSWNGHAIEARIYAEDPNNDFLPSTGKLIANQIEPKDGIRWDSGVEAGMVIGTDFDPMMAKVIAHGSSRLDAARKLAKELESTHFGGFSTNVEFLASILRHKEFILGNTTTDFIDRFNPTRSLTLQDSEQKSVAITAALWLQGLNRSQAVVLEGIPSGWSNARLPKQRIAFEMDTRLIEIYYMCNRDGSFTVDNQHEVVLHDWSESAVDIEIDGIRTLSSISMDGDQLLVQCLGGNKLLIIQPRFKSSHDQEQQGSLVSPMPGKVVELQVKQGDRVKAGDNLLMIEAMKMNHIVKANEDGVIAELFVQENDQLDYGAVLMIIEPKG